MRLFDILLIIAVVSPATLMIIGLFSMEIDIFFPEFDKEEIKSSRDFSFKIMFILFIIFVTSMVSAIVLGLRGDMK